MATAAELQMYTRDVATLCMTVAGTW